jgi:tetratricopeptide (TPR) repeat protein
MLDDEFTLDKARVLKGKILIELGKLQQAEDLLAPIGEKSGTHQADAYFHLGIIYKQQGNVLKSYVFLKEAAARSHEAAKQYIVDEFTEFLEKLREINMDSKKTAFSKNERSSFFNKIFGKLWVFNDLKSEGLASAGFTNEQVKTFKDTFSLSSLVVAEKGILMLSDDKEQMATYNIKKETANGAVIDFLPLDGVESYEVKLQLTKDGRLVFSKQKGELLVYKEQHPTQLAPAIKAIYQEKINVTDSQYLGNKVTPILEQIL